MCPFKLFCLATICLTQHWCGNCYAIPTIQTLGIKITTDNPKDVYVTFVGDINQSTVNKVCTFFNGCVYDKIETVHLLIHSIGGFVSDGIFLYNYLSNLPLKLITYNAGNVSSIAVTVFLAGHERYASDTATFMLHHSHVSAAPATTTAELVQIAASLDLDDTRTNAILIKFTNDAIAIPAIGNLTLCATDALKAGLVSKILHFSPPQNANLHHIQP